MSTTILRLMLYYCSIYHVDPFLVESIISVESGWSSNKVGAAGEIGLMQLMPAYFPYSVDYLRKPENNLRLGIEYLSELKDDCPHKFEHTFVVCYNKGRAGAAKVKHPKRDPYYRKVMQVYNKLQVGETL